MSRHPKASFVLKPRFERQHGYSHEASPKASIRCTSVHRILSHRLGSSTGGALKNKNLSTLSSLAQKIAGSTAAARDPSQTTDKNHPDKPAAGRCGSGAIGCDASCTTTFTGMSGGNRDSSRRWKCPLMK